MQLRSFVKLLGLVVVLALLVRVIFDNLAIVALTATLAVVARWLFRSK